MIKYTLFGGEYSYLIPLLLCEKNIGQVHSIFANGFNIKMGDSLIFIGNKKNGLLPFGIHLTPIDTSRAVMLIKSNESVFWDKDTASLIFSEMSLSLEKGSRFKNDIFPVSKNVFYKDKLTNLKELLITNGQPTGLDIYINEFLSKYDRVSDENWSEGEQYILGLMDVVLTNDHSLIEKTLRFFLGRGKGLTPSGDDLMVGLLAFASITNFISVAFYEELSKLVEKEPITTDVSKEYLRYALKNEFSSTVTDVINSIGSNKPWLSEAAFDRLLGVGHSSGLDTLFGILVGMLAYNQFFE
ncbi:hypothetical protein BACCIP111895_02084 [Neobacillus rhizosphaerae]|uniref:DUF2877 domain-containing protein n=1 Tax=Neobacillus rhizosphaerae TaxID=2880965 RepID=A0ABM9EQK0_9BACI|nr:DUF2877 domain-containing protein [Neobacillus rhizosphaerae]CAH2714908.1 hypothetical protein BACCIP111895_02084 [Neobacillus rhizosphaerae]